MKIDPNQAMLVHSLLKLFPTSIERALISDPEFLNQFGLHTTARLAFHQGGPSFQRGALFDGIRKAMARNRTIEVKDESGCSWEIEIYAEECPPFTLLRAKEQRIRMGFYWALSPDSSERLQGFDTEVDNNNLSDEIPQKFRTKIIEADLNDDELESYQYEFNNTPTKVMQDLVSTLESGSCSLSALIPNNENYYERLVGSFTYGEDLFTFAQNGGRNKINQLMSWRQQEGFKLSLLLSSHSWLTANIDIRKIQHDELIHSFTWILEHGDTLSKVGAIEIGLSNLATHPEIESTLELLVESVLGGEPSDINSNIAILSSLFILVSDELSRKKVFKDKAPFWTRLAAFAHASLIERALIASEADRGDFAAWARKHSGLIFTLQTLVDLRQEPKWLPDFIEPSQLRAEFLGRIAGAATLNQESIQSLKLRELILTKDHPNSMPPQLELPFPFLPGPLEGGYTPQMEIPEAILKDLENYADQETLQPKNFMGIANSALLFKVNSNHADLVAKALRKVRRHLWYSEDEGANVAMIIGLAVLSGVARCPELANEIRTLLRISRRNDRASIGPLDEIRIALVAASSRTDKQAWADYVGSWVEELAFGEIDLEYTKKISAYLKLLTDIEPILFSSFARANAALASIMATV